MSIFNAIRFLASGRASLGIMIIALLWLGALSIRAADYYVRPSATCTNTDLQSPYTSWDTAATNIQWAVNVATTNAPATVWVSNGTYCLTNQIEITNNITVQSTNGYSNTLVYAGWPTYTTRCFYVSRTGVVDGFSISNGHYMGSNTYLGGGGAWVGTGTIQSCYFVRNTCSNDANYAGGGGVFSSGKGTISNCIFFTNMNLSLINPTYNGGAAMALFGASNKVLNCLIVSNRSFSKAGGIYTYNTTDSIVSNCNIYINYSTDNGAAVSADAGSLTVTDCVISNNNGFWVVIRLTGSVLKNSVIVNNNSRSGVGAVEVKAGSIMSNCNVSGNSGSGGAKLFPDSASMATIVDCVFSNNINSAGTDGNGGVYIYNGGILRNCLIHHNTNTARDGGGVYLQSGATYHRGTSGVFNCTIANNYSTNEGGGIAASGLSNYIVNCVIAGNSSFSNSYPNVFHKDNVDANKSNYYYCCAVTTDAYLFAANQGNITNDPVFVNAGNWRLANNSPCINTGTNQNWMTGSFDLDGRVRIRYGTVDMGAYEKINEATIYNVR